MQKKTMTNSQRSLLPPPPASSNAKSREKSAFKKTFNALTTRKTYLELPPTQMNSTFSKGTYFGSPNSNGREKRVMSTKNSSSSNLLNFKRNSERLSN